jgi:hypothetical protein
MSGIFCSKTVDVVVKTSAILAGAEFAAQNPVLVKTALPVAQQIMATIDAGGSQISINAAFQLGVKQLLDNLGTSNPLILAAVQGVLTSINFNVNVPVPGATAKLLDNAVIKEVVDGFVQGMKAVVPAK